MKEQEEILPGGQSTESVVRVGNIVYRTTRNDNAELSHVLLQHLEANHFSYSPRFLGLDEKGREMLSYIEGVVPRGVVLSDQQLHACMRILREMHDLAAKSTWCNEQETICHHDFAPWNMIFKDGQPIGIIDFDEVAPGSRVDDVAYFIWTFLDLGVAEISDQEQIDRIGRLVKTYGLTDRKGLVAALFRQQNKILKFRENIIATGQGEQMRAFSQQAICRIKASIQWVISNTKQIEERLRY
jgi:Ser/Thr protein kinase RdoA (MazF antagonist)